MPDTPANNPPRHDGPVEGELFACYAGRLMADSRCDDILVLDVRGVSQVADFFLIATGTSDRQMTSVLRDLKDLAARYGQQVFRSEGVGDSGWAVMDLVDVVVHLFTTEMRGYYDLESLWGDAKRVDWRSRTTPGQFAKV